MKWGSVAMLAAAVALGGCAATVNRAGNGGGAGAASSNASLNIPAASTRHIAVHFSGTPAVTASADWAAFRGEFRNALQAQAAASGISFSEQIGELKTGAEAGTLLAVHVNDYRYLSSGARFGLGVMTGNAFVDSKVRFLDLKTGKPYGEQAYNTSSTAWQGVFSAMTDKQLQALAKEIVGDLGGH
jgi:hypothetical protein